MKPRIVGFFFAQNGNRSIRVRISGSHLSQVVLPSHDLVESGEAILIKRFGRRFFELWFCNACVTTPRVNRHNSAQINVLNRALSSFRVTSPSFSWLSHAVL